MKALDPPWIGRWTDYVVSTSGRYEADWPIQDDYWDQFARLFKRHQLTEAAAKDATLAARAKVGGRPDDLYKGLATVLDDRKQVNLPAANDAAPCDLCGFQGLVCIDRRDRSPIEVRIGAEFREVKHITVVCACPHGDRIRAAHGDKLPWRLLAGAERSRWQPLGGWPGETAPKLSVVGSFEEEDIPF